MARVRATDCISLDQLPRTFKFRGAHQKKIEIGWGKRQLRRQPMSFPCETASVFLPTGDIFHSPPVNHLYDLHLALRDADPTLPVGGFALHPMDEGDAMFALVSETSHLQTNVLLDEFGEGSLYVFVVSFEWWTRREGEEETPHDTWELYVAVDANLLHRVDSDWVPAAYGRYDRRTRTVTGWYDTMRELLLSVDPYHDQSIQIITGQLYDCIGAIILSDEE